MPPGEHQPEPSGIVEEIDLREGAAKIVVRGEIDVANVVDLRQAIEGCLDEGCEHIAMDMAKVDFIDADGIAVILWAKTSLPGGGVAVVNPSPAVESALKVRAVDQVVEIKPRDTS